MVDLHFAQCLLPCETSACTWDTRDTLCDAIQEPALTRGPTKNCGKKESLESKSHQVLAKPSSNFSSFGFDLKLVEMCLILKLEIVELF